MVNEQKTISSTQATTWEVDSIEPISFALSDLDGNVLIEYSE